MNRRFLLWLGLGSLFLPAQLLQADPSVSVPLGEVTCTVKVTWGVPPSLKPGDESVVDEKDKPKPPLDALKGVFITRKGKFRRDELSYADGTASEAWTLNDSGLTIFERGIASSKIMYEIPRGSIMRFTFCPPLLELDNSSLAWINPGSLTGDATINKRHALHYAAPKAIPRPGLSPRMVIYQAWIDPKTLVPIAFHDGDYLYELTFGDPPTEALYLPERFKNDLQRYYNANATLQHL